MSFNVHPIDLSKLEVQNDVQCNEDETARGEDGGARHGEACVCV